MVVIFIDYGIFWEVKFFLVDSGIGIIALWKELSPNLLVFSAESLLFKIS